MKRIPTLKLAITALCAALNIIGAALALVLRLPIYLDNIGTVLCAALLGPFYAVAASFLGSFISGITSDIYALYFMPSGLLLGLLAGFFFQKGFLHGKKTPLGVLALTLPGTFISSCISAFLFGGVTSSGSSYLVQFLSHIGFNLVASAFAVQFITDYADRLAAVVLVCIVCARLSAPMKEWLKRGKPNGTV